MLTKKGQGLGSTKWNLFPLNNSILFLNELLQNILTNCWVKLTLTLLIIRKKVLI